MEKLWVPRNSFVFKSHRTMPRCVTFIWGFFCTFMLKIFFFFEKYIDRMVDDDYKKNDSEELVHNSKYQYMSGEDASGFMERPEVKSFAIQEMFEGEGVGMTEDLQLDQIKEVEKEKIDHSPISEDRLFHFSFFNDARGHQEHTLEAKTSEKEKAEAFDEKEANDEEKPEVFGEKEANNQEIALVFDEKDVNDQEKTADQVEKLCGEEVHEKQKFLVDDEVFIDKETQSLEDTCFEIQLLHESDNFGNEDFGTSDESAFDRHLNGFLDSDQFMETNIEENDELAFIELETSLQKLRNAEETDDLQESPDHRSSRKSWDTDSDSDEDEDEDELDILLEHHNLVKQMKMEMRNSRIAGLPTISEDCESPKMVEDLKPLKIDEKIEYKDCLKGIHKFYKSYAEKMKKLDILNYQTLNAISFLQLKDSEVFMSSKKSSSAITKAFALPSLLANKQRKIFADPAHKSITEMNRDLEIVYVGQVCLSWEILLWQFGKAKELQEHDPHEYHSYNQVAGEYQQFQVLLQRFIEDEPFQGPRVQNYVKKRCILRSFLQVPSIRDDRFKERQGGYDREKYVISIVKLADIIKETMQVFWEFLRADKCEASLGLKGVQGTQMDPAEIELFMVIRSDLEKKERRLKDVQRSGNCIVKKLQKQREGRLSDSLFRSLVELKLVSRVMSLGRLRRDYLEWCQKKLSNINVAGRKVRMEPSFSLFPC